MKKIRILAVGKLKTEFRPLVNDYSKRISRFYDVQQQEIHEAEDQKKESDAILSALDGYTILLDRCGKEFSSEELADKLSRLFLLYNKVTFVVGGSCGVDKRVTERADERLSFGKMTFPHQLFRCMLLEQIYRSAAINASLPYHK
jgi:23S rRNA (pseudouridine1915-N3)-methyltransferase